MINKILLAVFLISLLGTAHFYFFATSAGKPASKQETEAETVSIENKTYRNEDWGFQFEYPGDWEISDQIVRSKSSIFSIILEPIGNTKFPRPIFINITEKSWGESVFAKLDQAGVTREEVKIANKIASYHPSEDIGIPMHSYFILIDNKNWINVAGKTDYTDTLNQILDSFEFIEAQ